jgi:hypothetical protein
VLRPNAFCPNVKDPINEAKFISFSILKKLLGK